MSNYILKYSRGNAVKYISHLDFIRLFHRAVRRAGLNMEYSQGFNPHPVMTVALPLSVGVTSAGEYMKIGFEDGYTEDEIVQRLNSSMPAGFQVLAAKRLAGKEIDLTKIDRAQYLVDIELKEPCHIDINIFLAHDEIKVMKKSKSGIKEADIRPYIYQMQIEQQDGNVLTLSMCLAAGSIYNLKPDTVIDAFAKYIDGFEAEFFSVHRVCMLAGNIEYLK